MIIIIQAKIVDDLLLHVEVGGADRLEESSPAPPLLLPLRPLRVRPLWRPASPVHILSPLALPFVGLLAVFFSSFPSLSRLLSLGLLLLGRGACLRITHSDLQDISLVKPCPVSDVEILTASFDFDLRSPLTSWCQQT